MKVSLFEKIRTLIETQTREKCTVLDIGCGSGELLDALHKTGFQQSKLIGIDASKEAINDAIEKLPSAQLKNEKFVDTLGFPDSSIDMVVSVDALECIVNKQSLVNEIHRVLKPNGKVVFAHWDWDTQIYNSEHKAIIRKFVSQFSDWQQAWMDSSDGLMGRKMWGQFQSAGKFKGQVDSYTLIETEYTPEKYGYARLHDISGLVEKGEIDKGDYELVLDEMSALNDSGHYFYSVTSFIYCGRRA